MKLLPVFTFLVFPFLHLFPQTIPIHINGFTQGTTYNITYFDPGKRNLQPEIEKILEDLNRSLSIYDSSSIISRVNSNDNNIELDKYFIACFTKAKEVWKNTDGKFDPTILPLLNAWGFGPGKKQKLEDSRIDSILSFTGFDLIELVDSAIRKKDSRVSLDFNAFAQGYSVDVIAAFLDSLALTSYIVEIGGEVYARGKKINGDFWKVGIEKATDNRDSLNPLAGIVNLENMALSTSGNYRKFYIENGTRYSHHIDPLTGYPSKNTLLSVSVLAADCISSDAYSTALFVMGFEKAIRFLEKHQDLKAYMIYSDSNGNYLIYASPGFELNKDNRNEK